MDPDPNPGRFANRFFACLEENRLTADISSAARERADAIRGRIDDLADVPRLIAEAYQAEDWRTLGYKSWGDYVSEEFGTSLLKLNTAMRKQWTHELKDAGMSTREIAPVTNVSQATVSRDSNESQPKSDTGTKGRKEIMKIGIPLSGNIQVIRLAHDAGHVYCPHCSEDIGAE